MASMVEDAAVRWAQVGTLDAEGSWVSVKIVYP